MEKDNKNAYSEVIEILKLVDDEKKLEALPMEMLEVLKSKANPEYKPQISKDIPLDEQNLQPETYSILSWIAVKYWDEKLDDEETTKTDTPEVTQPEKSSLEGNEQIKEETNMALVAYDDLKWYQKIKIRIINLFNRIFHKGRNEIKNDKEEGITL